MDTKETLAALLMKLEQLEKTVAKTTTVKQSETRFLKFTDKEIMQMPKSFRKTFRAQGCTAHIRKRIDGRYKCSYEIRYNRNGYSISASGRTIDEAKKRFIKKLNTSLPTDNNSATTVIPADFEKFAEYWFENFHKPKVGTGTFNNNLNLFERHIRKKLQGLPLESITPLILNNLIEALPGNGKTADDVHSILNQIFKVAVKHGKIKINPLDMIFHKYHDRETGTALTRDEELKLFDECKGTVYEKIFAVMLYTGLRPNEFKTAKIDGPFLVAVNSKRKDGKIEYKKIPISSLLRNKLDGDLIEIRSTNSIRKFFNKIFPEHVLKDLRKTFNTRCTELKIDYTARKLFMGHTLGRLDKTYTGNLDDYLLSEGEKLEQWYSLYPKFTPKIVK